MKKSLTTIVLVLLSMMAVAQDENQLTVDAQLRTRGEYNNGALSPRYEGESPATFINERARLSVGWQRRNLELKISAQHTGVWGQDDIKDRNGRVAMNEAWAKLKFGEGFFAQIGRQQLSYDDERILGGLDWNVAGNWHDALKVGYENDANRLHLILAMNSGAENIRGNYYTGNMPYKNMQTLWYHYQSSKAPLGLSLMIMNLGRESGVVDHAKTKYMQTLGTDITFRPNRLELHGAFYYQTGKTPGNLKVNALMASAKAAVNLDERFKVSAGYDFLGGEDYESAGTTYDGVPYIIKADAGKTRAFNPLYGTHHKFYGSMDYFYASPFVNGLACGLQDIQAGVDFKISPRVGMQLNYHYFLTASDILVTDGKGLGHELDYQLTAKLMKDVTLMAGYSIMRGTETMDAVKGGNHKSWQDWAFIQLNINPRLFTTKW